MTPTEILADNARRKELRHEEPLFRQQSPLLQNMGQTVASMLGQRGAEPGDATLDALARLDLTVWDASQRLLSDFAGDLADAPYAIDGFLQQTWQTGRAIGMEQLPQMVAAFTLVRIMAGGKDVHERHNRLCRALVSSQTLNPVAKPRFERFCQLFDLNKYDPTDGHETIYRRGDPMERMADAPQEQPKPQAEAVSLVLEATNGWNTKGIFAPHWTVWEALWQHLCEDGDFNTRLMRKAPNSNKNHTQINMQMVCNVCRLFKAKTGCQLTDTQLAKAIATAWDGESPRGYIGEKNTALTKADIKKVNGWLAQNIK